MARSGASSEVAVAASSSAATDVARARWYGNANPASATDPDFTKVRRFMNVGTALWPSSLSS
jgi:hypothetical protein